MSSFLIFEMGSFIRQGKLNILCRCSFGCEGNEMFCSIRTRVSLAFAFNTENGRLFC